MDGFVYIMSNPALGNRIKIGKSSRDPKSFREKELDDTAIPEPFKVEYSAFVENYDKIEKKIHDYFNHCRPNKKREFFTCTISEAIAVIESISIIKFKENFHKCLSEIEIEKNKLEMISLKKKESEDYEKFREDEKKKFNNAQLERREKYIKEVSPYAYTWEYSYLNFCLFFIGSVVVFFFVDSFLFEQYKKIPNFNWIIPASVVSSWIIHKHIKNKKIDEVVDHAIEKYPVSTASGHNGEQYFRERPILCIFNFKTGKKFYYARDFIHESFETSEILKIHDYSISVKNISEAESLGFKKPQKLIGLLQLKSMLKLIK